MVHVYPINPVMQIEARPGPDKVNVRIETITGINDQKTNILNIDLNEDQLFGFLGAIGAASIESFGERWKKERKT